MDIADEDLKNIANMKLWLQSKINDLKSQITEIELEIDNLHEFEIFTDKILGSDSFKSASTVENNNPIPPTSSTDTTIEERKLINSDNLLLGIAEISKSKITIKTDSNLRLNVDTAPFKSFFLTKILGGMKNKDLQLKNNNELSSDIIDYTVNDTNNLLDEIIITNFGDKTRINQIINTIMWTFSKMLEKNIR
tara:strand:- start:363 stop:941 length:579 start_codon:yes stop_codon:yes gene_type:complete